MRGFNVLDRHLPLYRNHFLEASAGTGKTFAIENVVVRLLMDPKGPEIDQLLVVTFTRAATIELKNRIHQNLKRTLHQIQNRTENPPDYLQALSEKGAQESVRRLKLALATFEEAKIFTIHSFCLHTLQEHALEADLALDHMEESAPIEELEQIVKDYLRTELTYDQIHPKQLEIVLKKFQNSIDLLVRKLVETARQRLPIRSPPSFADYKRLLFDTIETIKRTYTIEPDSLFADLYGLAPQYGKLCDRQRRVKPEIEAGLRTFVKLFEQIDDDFIDLPILKMIPENQLKRESGKPSPLFQVLQKKLIPIMQKASDSLAIFARLAEQCRQHLEKVIEKEELLFFEDFLQRMEKKVADKYFAQEVRSRYRAVLIDEFQDTDPIQWNIFSTLFLTPLFHGPFYVVGDPKQSIYRFRNGNIYTYLEAKQAFGKEAQASLNSNYRSQPELVSALNQLFAAKWLSLPKTGQSLPCLSVKAAIQTTTSWKDGKGSIHFAVANNEKKLFAFIIQEIHTLHTTHHIPYRECAVLVKDRYQANRFLTFSSLPTVSKKSRSLVDSHALPILEELLKATINPRNHHSIAAVLGGPIFGYTLQQITDGSLQAIEQFYHYHHLLQREGLLSVFNALMEKQGAFLIGQKGGEELVHDLLQLVELAIEETDAIDGYLPFLHRLKQGDPEADFLKARSINGDNAVQVLTIHASKGLEYSVVFPIGLTASLPQKRGIIRSHTEKALVLSEVEEKLSLEENEAEQMRLLYVAATRAKKRLYLPFLENRDSPLSLFLKKRFQETSLEAFVQEHKPLFSLSCCHSDRVNLCFPSPEYPLLIPPKPRQLSFSALTIHSYSSLTTYEPPISPPSPKEKLPAGPEMGKALHQVFEKYPNTPIASLLKNTILEPWISEVSEMVDNVFNTPLPSALGSFSLSAVDPQKRIQEMEFLFRSAEGFYKGFIDLFFEHEEYYYFIDWKSNVLEEYTFPQLEKAMHAHQYTLQATLYREAVERYLKIFQKKQQFGGYYYLFIRGMHPTRSTGIYYVRK